MYNQAKISNNLNIFIKCAQTVTHTDPIYDALNARKLGPGTVQNNPLLMSVVQEMAEKGVPARKTFDIGLIIGPNKVPQFKVNPNDSIVLGAFNKFLAKPIQATIAKIPLDNNFVVNQWIQDLYWE